MSLQRECRVNGGFCEDAGVPCDDCPFCQGDRCGACGGGPCLRGPSAPAYEVDHDVCDRHEGVQAAEAPGL